MQHTQDEMGRYYSSTQNKFLLEAASVIELALHKVPLNQMNVTLASNTFAIESPIFVGMFRQNRLL